MEEVLKWIVPFIPVLPLLSTAAITFIPPVYESKKLSARLTIGLMAISLVLSIVVLVGTLAHPTTMDRLQNPHVEHAAETAPAAGHGTEPAGEHSVAPAGEGEAAGHYFRWATGWTR